MDVMTEMVRSRNFSWARTAGPHAFNVAATFRLMSVTTDLNFVSNHVMRTLGIMQYLRNIRSEC